MTSTAEDDDEKEYKRWRAAIWEIEDNTGLTELHKAVYRMDSAAVEAELKAGASLTALSPRGLPPLHLLFTGPDVTDPEDRDSRDRRYKDLLPDETTSKALSVLHLLVACDCNLNMTSKDGRRITDYPTYWQCNEPLHEWMVRQDLLLPDLDLLNDKGHVGYTHMRDKLHLYLQAGSRSPFAVRSVVAMNSLKHDFEELTLAYRACPQLVRKVNMGWLFKDERFDEIETLEYSIQCFIFYIYRVSDGPYYDSYPPDDHIYWRLQAMKKNPSTLVYLCAESIRSQLVLASRGHSILRRIVLLPLPTKLRRMLEINKPAKPKILEL